jgi:hypothetical protein
MNHPNYDKKHWLNQHIKAIQNLEQQGYTQQQIIEQLKTDYGMPFQLDKSLYSRHLKKIKAEQQSKNQEQKNQADYHELKKYCDYLEQSNSQLLEQQRLNQKEKHKPKIENSKQTPQVTSQIKNDDNPLKLQIKRLESALTKEASQHQKTQGTLLKTQKERKYYSFFVIFFSSTTLFFMILLILKP